VSRVDLQEVDGRWMLTLNDPDRRNAIDADMQHDLAAAVTTVAQDAQARVLVVTGAGSSFCAGAGRRCGLGWARGRSCTGCANV